MEVAEKEVPQGDVLTREPYKMGWQRVEVACNEERRRRLEQNLQNLSSKPDGSGSGGDSRLAHYTTLQIMKGSN